MRIRTESTRLRLGQGAALLTGTHQGTGSDESIGQMLNKLTVGLDQMKGESLRRTRADARQPTERGRQLNQWGRQRSHVTSAREC